MDLFLILLGLVAAAFLLLVTTGFRAHLRVPPLEIAESAPADHRVEQIDRWLWQLFDQNKFNGGVLIARHGEPLLMQTYGFTDHTAEQELTTNSAFRLASVSKQFTAAGVLVLATQGRLGLDDLVKQQLNGFPYADVTVRHLLNQTSAIPDVYSDLANQHRSELGDTLRIEDVVALIKKYPPKSSARPGATFQYSNTNYVLLAGIVEQASERSFEQFMLDEIFDPLGMKDSRVWNLVSPSHEFPERAFDFDQVNDIRTVVERTWVDGVAGDGGVFTSLDDLLIWDEFWRGNRLVRDDLLSQVFEKPRLLDNSRSDYGFGWVIEDNCHWHNGAWLGARTYLVRHPKTQVCLAIVDNSSNLRIDKITDAMERAIVVWT